MPVMDNPVLVNVSRGNLTESIHRGSIAVVDAEGNEHLTFGNVEKLIFPRSAIKALQAINLVRCGAADNFQFGNKELALASSSHNGEQLHVYTASKMLAAAGLGPGHLECGPQPPRLLADQKQLIEGNTEPQSIHNNCSGKHAAMLASAKYMGLETKGYSIHEHPLQCEIRNILEGLYECDLTHAPYGIDGCSIPTYAVPLKSMAHAFAKFISGKGIEANQYAATKRIALACMNEPFMVAGSDRFCTQMMLALPQRVFVKTGAEGVFCAALPELELGIALKIDDGAPRASEVAMAELIAYLLPLSQTEKMTLTSLRNPGLKNWADIEVGHISFADALLPNDK